MTNQKQIKIEAIERGVAIDHIPAGQALNIIDILNLREDKNCIISIGMNLASKKMGKKDVIKVENKFIYKTDLEKISLVAPQATISFIKNFKVGEKIRVHVPDVVHGLIKCKHPNCITNHEKIKTRFYLVKEKPLEFKCHYCERKIKSDEIKIE